MKKRLLILFFLLTISFSGIAASQEENEKSLISGLNKFAINFYHALSKTEENRITSPYSLSSLLVLLTMGATGDTRQQFLHILNIDKISNANIINTDTKPNIKKERSPDFMIANAIWAADNFTYKKAFLDIMQKNKTGNFNRIHFATAEKARTTINQWVAKNTSGYIPELFEKGEVDPQTRLLLTNTVFFKGLWQFPFKSQDTQQKPFLLDHGKPSQVAMMHQQHDFGYAENKYLQMLQLPYAGSTLEMIILLPKEKHTIQKIAQLLTFDMLMKLLQIASNQQVIVNLPRFKIQSTLESFTLIPLLQNMGLVNAFNPNKANFFNITAEPLFINGIKQKAIIEVDEQGTVAAAATGMALMGSLPKKPVSVNANHPFLFILMDTASKIILFMGQVTNPTR